MAATRKQKKVISYARFIGIMKSKNYEGTPAIIECKGVRFFSLAAKDAADADRINAAAESLV